MTARHIIADAPTYAVPMRPLEYRALAWIADRYPSAQTPYDGATYRPFVLMVPETVAAAYLRALPQDNGNPWQTVPPCAGGPLADALLSLTACAYDYGAPGTVPTDEERWALADLPRCDYCAADHAATTCPNAPEEDYDR